MKNPTAETVVTAAGVFAPSSFARLRLVRQLHASGLLFAGSRALESPAPDAPPTDAPPTDAPPTDAPPTDALPTADDPADGAPRTS